MAHAAPDITCTFKKLRTYMRREKTNVCVPDWETKHEILNMIAKGNSMVMIDMTKEEGGLDENGLPKMLGWKRIGILMSCRLVRMLRSGQIIRTLIVTMKEGMGTWKH